MVQRSSGRRKNRRNVNHRMPRLEMLERRNLLATITVTSLADEVVVDSNVTLREALIAANTNVPVSGSVAGESTAVDVIEFAPGLSGTIELEAGELEITEAVRIVGPATGTITINAQGASRLFSITQPAGNVALEALTLTGGVTANDMEHGGAIFFDSPGTLTLDGVSVLNSVTEGDGAHGGGVYIGQGNLIATDSLFKGNRTTGSGAHGGAIYVGNGTVTIGSSEFSENQTAAVGPGGAQGGAIFLDQAASATAANAINNTLFSNNAGLSFNASGGAIAAFGRTLAITGSTFSNNLVGEAASGSNANGGGAILANGVNLSVVDSIFTGNAALGMDLGQGGAINSIGGSLEVLRSSFSNNSTRGERSPGGAIYLQDVAAIVDSSTLSANFVAANESDGGAVFVRRGSLDVRNSTFSANETRGVGQGDNAGGAIAAVETATVAIRNSTIALNKATGFGGGVAVDSKLTIVNSIVAGNDDNDTAPDFQAPTTPSDLSVSFSLIGTNVGTTLTASPIPTPGSGNIVGGATAATFINPLLGPLANNGGPTLTHALLAGSPAIDTGDPAAAAGVGNVPFFDQRGGISPPTPANTFPRVSGSRIDLGAFELQAAPKTYVVTVLNDELNLTNSSVSLREAIQLANENQNSKDVITFAEGLTGTITLTAGEYLVTDSVVIEGLGSEVVTIDAGGLSRHFNIGAVTTEISGLTLINGDVSVAAPVDPVDPVDPTDPTDPVDPVDPIDTFGGSIFTSGSITLTDVVGRTNKANEGGFLYLNPQFTEIQAIVSASTIAENESLTFGGGLRVFAGQSLRIVDSLVDSNVAVNGGGLANGGAIVSIMRSRFTENQSTNGAGGGAIRSFGELLLRDATIDNNHSDEPGGGIFFAGQTLTIINSTLAGNSSAQGGGAIATEGMPTIKLVQSTLTENRSDSDDNGTEAGGALLLDTGTIITLSNTIVAGNFLGTATTANDIEGSVDTANSFNNLVGAAASAGGLVNGENNNRVGFAANLEPAATSTDGLVVFFVPTLGSMALDGGSNARALDEQDRVLSTDQRGQTRILDGSGDSIATVDIGSVERSAAVINTAPTISDVSNQTIPRDGATGPISFTIADDITSTDTLGLSGTSTNKLLVPDSNIVFSGTGANRTVTITPAPNQSGSTTITITVMDAGGLSASDSFLVTVTSANNAPIVSNILDLTTTVNTATSALPFTISDTESPVTSLVVTTSSSNVALVPNSNVVLGGSGGNRTVTVTPASGQTGTTTITITVADPNGASTIDTFVLTVAPPNTAPTISNIADQTVLEATATSPIAFTISDAETAAESLVVSATSSDTTLVPAESFAFAGQGANRTLVITPAGGQFGTATITVNVRDASGATAFDTFVLTVTADDTPPTITSIEDVMIQVSTATQPIAFTIADTQTIPTALTVAVTSSNETLVPATAIVVSGTGAERTLVITPTPAQTGTATITVSVTDADENVTTETFVLTVTDLPNTPPVISNIADQSTLLSTATTPITFTVNDLQSNPDTLVLSASSSNTSLVPDANIVFGGSGSERTVTITPTLGQAGTTTITITVTDDEDLTDTTTFVLTVSDPDNATPTISSIVDQATAADTPTSPIPFTIGDAETAANLLTLSVSSSNETLVAMSNITILGEGANRTITITPNAGQTGTTRLTITVKDQIGLSSSEAFTLAVGVPLEVPEVIVSPTGPNGQPDPENLPSGTQPTSWAQQRSMIRQLVVDLPTPLNATPSASDVRLTNLGVDPVADADQVIALRDNQLSLSTDGTKLTISLDADQLSDGVYQLELLSGITGGDSFTITGNATNKLFVLKGDWNGDGGVNIRDFATFAYWFAQSTPTAPEYVDLNQSGGVNILDFSAFATNFGKSLMVTPGVAPQQVTLGSEGELTSALRTLVNPPDVNGDGNVTTGDALDVLGALSADGTDTNDEWLPQDVNRDGQITAGDALFVINRLVVNEVEAIVAVSPELLGKSSGSATASTQSSDDLIETLFAQTLLGSSSGNSFATIEGGDSMDVAAIDFLFASSVNDETSPKKEEQDVEGGVDLFDQHAHQ